MREKVACGLGGEYDTKSHLVDDDLCCIWSGLASRTISHREHAPRGFYPLSGVYNSNHTQLPPGLLSAGREARQKSREPLVWNHHLCDTYVISGDFWVICSQEMRTMSTRLIV